MKTSIIIPIYNHNEILLNKLENYLVENFNGEVLILNGEKGLAHTYNEGIKQAKGNIVIITHSDCLPLGKDSIQKLVKPFEDSKVVMAYSQVLDEDSGKVYYPNPPDQKFNAFRKDALEKVGLFKEDLYFAGGEDVDIFLRLRKIGKVVKVNTCVIHQHKNYLGNKTAERIKQNGTINGALFRIWGFQNPKWLKAIFLCIKYPKSYGGNFIKAFVKGKQEYRRATR